MANELKIITQMRFSKGGTELIRGSKDTFVTVSGNYAVHNVQAVGFAAAEALIKGDITTVGYCWFKNLDATNFVEVGYDDTGFKNVIKLKAGEEAVVRLGQNTPQAQADTAGVKLEYIMVED